MGFFGKDIILRKNGLRASNSVIIMTYLISWVFHNLADLTLQQNITYSINGGED